MNRTRTRLTTPASSSGDVLHLTAPTSWEELNDEQLHYVLSMIMQGTAIDMLKVQCFVRFTGILLHKRTKAGYAFSHGRKRFLLHAWQIESFSRQFDYLDHPEQCRRRFDEIGGKKAPDVELHGVDFRTYLTVENLYQAAAAAMNEDDGKEAGAILDEMVRILYGTEPQEFTEVERLSVFVWYTYVKANFRSMFPRLFRGGNPTEDYDPMDTMNTQVRALTGGDITKEEMVFSSDVWRALTELEAKIKEYDEIKSRSK